MHQEFMRGVLVAFALFLPACGDSTGADARIETVDQLLGRVCELAADCPGVSATDQDIADCPLGIESQLGSPEIAELEQFLALSTVAQGTVLDCIGTAICGRFGGGLGSISDSDMMEPYRECMASA
jgi:hypothetical protein